MPAQKAFITTMYTPVDENSERQIMLPRTVAKAVRYTNKEGTEVDLQAFLDSLKLEIDIDGLVPDLADKLFVVSDTQPDHPCLWAKVLETQEA